MAVRHFNSLSQSSPASIAAQSASKFSLKDAGSFGPNTSYENEGGTGDRTALISVSFNATLFPSGQPQNAEKLLNGSYANEIYFGFNSAGSAFVFTFPSPRYIDEITWRQSLSSSHGTWKFQGLNGGTYVDLSSSFTLGGATVSVYPMDLYDGTSYTTFRLLMLSGTTDNAPWIREIEFKIDEAP